MNNADGVLIVAVPEEGKLPPAVHELATLAARLAAEGAGPVTAALLGDESGALAAALIARGATRVYDVRAAGLAGLPVEALLACVAEVCRAHPPRIVLVPHGVIGAELAPRLAFRLGGSAVTGCSDASFEGGVLRCTRPCYGGLAREVSAVRALPGVVSVRAGAFEPAPAVEGRTGETLPVPVDAAALCRTRVVERRIDAVEGVRLEEARVIVAGGRGLEGPEGFKVLEGLAQALGGAVGASRVPCDLGWCPHSWQIGLTGKTVTPDLYIAVGISGAGHHMAGCGNSRTLVAINTDREASIFGDARFGVIGDYREIVPAMVEAVKRIKATGDAG